MGLALNCARTFLKSAPASYLEQAEVAKEHHCLRKATQVKELGRKGRLKDKNIGCNYSPVFLNWALIFMSQKTSMFGQKSQMQKTSNKDIYSLVVRNYELFKMEILLQYGAFVHCKISCLSVSLVV